MMNMTTPQVLQQQAKQLLMNDHIQLVHSERDLSLLKCSYSDDNSSTTITTTTSSLDASNDNDDDAKIHIGILMFHKHNKSVNTLDRDLMQQVESLFRVVDVSSQLQQPTTTTTTTTTTKTVHKDHEWNGFHAIVFCSLRKGFIVGADVNMIQSIRDPLEAQRLSMDAHELLFRFEAIPIPTIAAIHGNCLGGGLELALSCSHRVASTDRSTNMGLPEIKLGIIPGTGGTIRLPRIIGLSSALQMILTGMSVSAQKAKKMGLVDHLVELVVRENDEENAVEEEETTRRGNSSEEGSDRDAAQPLEVEKGADDQNKNTVVESLPIPKLFLNKVVQYAIDLAKARINNTSQQTRKNNALADKYWRRSIPFKELIMERNQYGRRLIENQSRKTIAKLAKKHYPAPYVALDAVMRAYEAPTLREAARIEAKRFGQIVCTREAKYFIHLFQSMESLKKPVLGGGQEVSQPIKKVGVIGTGTMGCQIAQLCAYHNYTVLIQGRDNRSATNAMARIVSIFNTLVSRGRITEHEKNRFMAKITPLSGSNEETESDQLAECDIIIDAALAGSDTIKQFLKVIESKQSNTIITTNSCSITVDSISSASNQKQNVLGLQFFAPVHRVSTVEIVKTDSTSDESFARVHQFVLNLGKLPIVVSDGPGFLLSRLFALYCSQAISLMLKGWSFEMIDALLEEYGFQTGPFQVMDESGLDVCLLLFPGVLRKLQMNHEPCSALQQLVQQKALGKKSGSGFYLYDKKRNKVGVNPLAVRLFNSKTKRVTESQGKDLVDCCVLTVVNSAADCLDQGIVTSADQLDTAMVLGFGFPPFRGCGALGYADEIGPATIVTRLHELSDKFPGGSGLIPSRRLVSMSISGQRFFPDRVEIQTNPDVFPKVPPLFGPRFYVALASLFVVIFAFIMFNKYH